MANSTLSSTQQKMLDWLKGQDAKMTETTVRWSAINSHTFNTAGVKRMGQELEKAFSSLEGNIKWHDLPDYRTIDSNGEEDFLSLGKSLQIEKRTDAKKRALLVIHMDTVYPLNAPQQPILVLNDRIEGPGVADAKGGIVILLWALKAFEKFHPSSDLGWTVLLNSDEETGSPSSKQLLFQLANEHDVGIVFEPALPDGNLVGERKGSGNFTLIARGKSAHAGRDPHLGKNAIIGLSDCLTQINQLNDLYPGLTVNIGTIRGGHSLNVVPDIAIGGFNIRISRREDQQPVIEKISKIIAQSNQKSDIQFQLEGEFQSPPKPFDSPHQQLFEILFNCGDNIGLSLTQQATGGVCDGNKLADYGLPTIDTLGVQGGNIHSPNEYCLRHSLCERAQLTALFLTQLASKPNLNL